MLLKNHAFLLSLGLFGVVLGLSPSSAAAQSPGPREKASEGQQSPAAGNEPADSPDSADDAEDIDERFSTEGYVGGYVALLQHTVPTIGLTASMYLDDGFRFGADISRGSSKLLYGAFVTQGASVWGAWELGSRFWLKGGMGYSSLEKPTTQEPLSYLLKGKDSSAEKQEDKSDTLGVDVSFGQLWSFPKYSVSVDYLGFTIPLLRLTGPKMPLYSLHAARLELLYNLE
ncbi:MAG: hypothetical protein FJY29_04270 [Betaproteobacteria bacterium]|nr:hypothetical protein [Betaproteobacteria bacterium]